MRRERLLYDADADAFVPADASADHHATRSDRDESRVRLSAAEAIAALVEADVGEVPLSESALLMLMRLTGANPTDAQGRR